MVEDGKVGFSGGFRGGTDVAIGFVKSELTVRWVAHKVARPITELKQNQYEKNSI
jgi:hypothetical protein